MTADQEREVRRVTSESGVGIVVAVADARMLELKIAHTFGNPTADSAKRTGRGTPNCRPFSSVSAAGLFSFLACATHPQSNLCLLESSNASRAECRTSRRLPRLVGWLCFLRVYAQLLSKSRLSGNLRNYFGGGTGRAFVSLCLHSALLRPIRRPRSPTPRFALQGVALALALAHR